MSIPEEYVFTEDWFSCHITWWNAILGALKPRNILEIGSFEGRATCHLIEFSKEYATEELPVHIHCIDTWEGGVEHSGLNFGEIEKRFDDNCCIATSKNKFATVTICKGTSYDELLRMGIKYKSHFDLIYVDGSHDASDVFFDAAMTFRLLRVDGVLIFDDVHDEGPETAYKFPKVAINGFYQSHRHKIKPLTFDVVDEKTGSITIMNTTEMYQLYLTKTSE